MHELIVSKTIDHPIERVWPLLDNFADTYVYHPVVESSKALGSKRSGLGARRQCTMYDGNSVQEEITEHHGHRHAYKVVVTDHGPFPLTDMRVWVRAERKGGKTRVAYELEFQPKFGPLGWLMAKLMMKSQFNKMLSSLIDGIDQHLQTGRVVEKGGELGRPIVATA